MKKTFQDVLRDIENNLIGVELSSISGNATLFSIFKIDYGNKNIILNVQGKKRTWTFERLEKVWNEMYYSPAANVEIIFGGSGSSRNQVETIFASMAYVEWLYVNSKKCVAYVGENTHPYVSLKHMDTEKEKQYQEMMTLTFSRNPLLDPDENRDDEKINEYQLAANFMKEYALEEGFKIPKIPEEIEATLDEFRRAYAPDVLEALDDSSLLSSMFYTVGDNTNTLCCWLEMNKECRTYFGSIAGGSAYKFGLFQRKETGVWTTGSAKNPQELSEEEALALGKSIRDALVKGVRMIREATLDSLEAYEKLHDALNAEVGSKYYNWGWVHKYFSIICKDKFCGYHSTNWQLHVLRSLKIRPSEKYYARSGQIAMIQNYAGWDYKQFYDVFAERFGEPKQFVRLGSSGDGRNYAAEWAKRGVVGIGWAGLGNLSEYVKGESIERKEIQDKLKELYYPSDERSASRKAGEIARYYKCDKNTVFVVMDGEQLIAIADNVGDYFFDSSSPMAHQRTATWKFTFEKASKLPEKSEGKMTSCYQLSNEDNLLFLYDRHYYGEDFGNHLKENQTIGDEKKDKLKPITFHTGYHSDFERNRILFGAPGTGKSYTINEEAKKLLGDDNDTDYERVTFHPDYSYANFVGTYKPVPIKDIHGNDTITYAYVPGPFMRVYVQALKNSCTDDIRPFLLIIEEINRAHIAAVFGDIFQLLDRNQDMVSEYPIQMSEDIKAYLVKELGGKPEDYAKIRIPDNMFIWATMNSADQGVFPMDTAFKRRWDFTYLGIDDNDGDVRGKYVVMGSKVKQRIEWNALRKAINEFLAEEKINEDKQLGPYFISRSIVVPENDGTEIDSEKFCRVFKNKVLMYLFDDAAKQKRIKLFEGSTKGQTRYSKICESFDEQGIGIFHQSIQSAVDIFDVVIEEHKQETNENE